MGAVLTFLSTLFVFSVVNGTPLLYGTLGEILTEKSGNMNLGVAILYVPLCQRMGFSVPATIILMSAAAALGDAGSPASDTTLGPTAGLNADGQHNHIWDTCVPTFLHYNIPLMIGAIVLSQFV